MARILVVDDDPAQRFLFVQLLRRTGYDAIGAEDAAAAFDTLNSGIPFDAILTDMYMPGLHGLAFLHALKQAMPNMPIVAMSVRTSKDWELDVDAEGVRFLQKPFDRETLTRTLREAMGLHGQTVT